MERSTSSQVTADSAKGNGESTLGDLFALSDEQILEIEPEPQDASAAQAASPAGLSSNPQPPETDAGKVAAAAPTTTGEAQRSAAEPQVAQTGLSAPHQGTAEIPPKWLADLMADPQRGGEAKQFWAQTQQATTCARQLEELDRAYFAGDGKSPGEVAAARERLAETLLREDPAAFREMVFTGLRALEKANVAPPFRAASAGEAAGPILENAGLPTASGRVPPGATQAAVPDLASYAAFEKAANEELDRDVGGAIGRVLEQALPNAAKADSAPLRERLSGAVRQDIEAALRGDRQLGEQVALIISGRRPGEAGTPTPRFDDTTRAQVVRLIGERARQLVPAAARRVLNDWTQTALGAHRARAQKAEAAATRPDVEGVGGAPANVRGKSASLREIDYRKLSDEQILDL